MAKILFQQTLLPTRNGPENISGQLSPSLISADLSDAVPREHSGLARSMNRAGLLLSKCCLPFVQNRLTGYSPDRIGVYCAVDQCSGSQNEIVEYQHTPEGERVAAYIRLFSPKWGLQTSIGLVASSLSILLGTEGGVHTFHHHRWACRHAVQQAEMDVEMGAVDIALVCAVSSGEDSVAIEKYREPGKRFSEGVGVMALFAGSAGASGDRIELRGADHSPVSFGIADPLISFLHQSVCDVT